MISNLISIIHHISFSIQASYHNVSVRRMYVLSMACAWYSNIVSQKKGLTWLVLLIPCWFLKKIHTFIQAFTHSCLIIHLVNVTLNRTPISYIYKVNYFFTLPLWSRRKVPTSSFSLNIRQLGGTSQVLTGSREEGNCTSLPPNLSLVAGGNPVPILSKVCK